VAVRSFPPRTAGPGGSAPQGRQSSWSAVRTLQRPIRVLIAGGGFAALEAGLALRALAEDQVALTVVAPEPVLRYRPAATAEMFDSAPPRTYPLESIVRDLGASWHRSRLEAVASQRRHIRLASGERLSYDALVLAIGARALAGLPGARMFRDQRDLPLFRGLLTEIDQGTVERVVFAVPAGVSWPLPVYELALLTAAHSRRSGCDPVITLVTPERNPLAVFGDPVSSAVGELLVDGGVRFVGSATPVAVRRDGALELQADLPVPADAVVTVPQLSAHRIAGVPASWWGFVPTDSSGRVEGLDRVYAAGDITAFPVKQGGLAAQQADRIAESLAAELGLPVKEGHDRRILQARLLAGDVPLMLRSELDWRGRPTTAAVESLGGAAGSDHRKVFGRYLTPYLEGLDAAA
jgi:sulfide:quinone oxidoreductase